jgi:hypothetical protein
LKGTHDLAIVLHLPLINDACSESRKFAALATSFGFPSRYKGILDKVLLYASSFLNNCSAPLVFSTRPRPGTIAFTLIPYLFPHHCEYPTFTVLAWMTRSPNVQAYVARIFLTSTRPESNRVPTNLSIKLIPAL